MIRRKSVFFAFLLYLVACVSLHAQVSKITSTSAFDEDSIRFDFQEYQADVQAADVLGKWGLNFQALEANIPKVRMIVAPIGGADPDRVIQNQMEATSSSLPLIVNFKYPVSKVGFFASNGSDTTTITLTAFDPLGANLGNVSESGLAQEKFLGVSTTSNRGIAKLLVDYGSSQDAEQIDDMIFDYVNRPKFNTYLAQVGDAKGLLQTILVISNLTNSTAKGELRLFDSSGAPLSLPVGEETKSVFPFSLAAFSSKTLPTTATSDPLKFGYAEIESNVPVEGTAVFRIVSGDTTLAEAGVGSSVPKPFAVGVVQKVVAQNFDTGIAAVNASDEAVDARVKLYDETGRLVDVNEHEMDLPAHGHKAKFVGELFPQLKNSDFRGTLVVTATKPMALTIIRTLGGLAQSTLPVGSTFQ
ncbi:MAG: hypothetical protein EHM61_05990 [Acidobacteria bacterium]|nr:MAG: hypothetical protein EHM61_05990 [Acidobacteriota bacterium]